MTETNYQEMHYRDKTLCPVCGREITGRRAENLGKIDVDGLDPEMVKRRCKTCKSEWYETKELKI